MIGLNKDQEQAVKHFKGPLLIIAGAGSGKTRALTHRVAYLIRARNVPAGKILAVTFTNKATGEMRDRLKDLLRGSNSGLPFIGTFHSLGVRILRKEIGLLGYESSFAIYDSQDQLSLVKNVLKELKLDPKQFNPRMLLGMISAAKNELQNPEDIKARSHEFIEEIAAKVYERYQFKLKDANACDFDDLLMLTVRLFKEQKQVLAKYQKLFEFIHVDEYQDTNHAQYTMINLLAAQHRNLAVVGDDWQAIYGWRGANLKNILEFERDYPEAKVVLLEQNYRSTQTILDAAGKVIAKNRGQKKKKLWTDNEGGDEIMVHEARDERDEAVYVVNNVKRLLGENIKPADIVVLYRTNAQSRPLEEACMQADLPYQIVGGVKFYDRKEVKDVMAYLRLLANPRDQVSFQRILNVPSRGLGPKSYERIAEAASQKFSGNYIDALLGSGDQADLETGRALRARDLGLALHKMRQQVLDGKNRQVATLIDTVIRTFNFETHLRDGSEEGEARFENIMELRTVASDRESLEDFLEQVALVQDTDNVNDKAKAITLMTAHAAKGLEYEQVFIVGMEEGVFPHSRALIEPKELAEERRLCYVGMTRARTQLYLLYAEQRQLYGDTQLNSRSRFLDDIPDHLAVHTSNAGSVEFESSVAAGSEGDDQPWHDEVFENPFKTGDRVRHPRFGAGEIVGIDDDLVDVSFEKGGTKTLSVNFAPLEKVG